MCLYHSLHCQSVIWYGISICEFCLFDLSHHFLIKEGWRIISDQSPIKNIEFSSEVYPFDKKVKDKIIDLAEYLYREQPNSFCPDTIIQIGHVTLEIHSLQHFITLCGFPAIEENNHEFIN